MQTLNKDCLFVMLDQMGPQFIHLRLVNRQWALWVLAYFNQSGYWARPNHSGKFQSLDYRHMDDLRSLVWDQQYRYYRSCLPFASAPVNLIPLRLTVNKFQETWIPVLTRLTYLTAHNYKGTGEGLSQLTNLTFLHAPDHCLAGIVGLTSLRTLKLSPKLSSYDPPAYPVELIGQLTYLTTLNLTVGPGEVDSQLAQLTSLTDLTISFGRETNFQGTCFHKLTQIKRLSFHGIKHHEGFCDAFLRLPYLTKFSNESIGLTHEQMRQLTQLKELSIQSNPADIAQGLTNLRKLSIGGHGSISLFDLTQGMTRLQHLCIFNRASIDPSQLLHLPNLRILSYMKKCDLSQLTNLRCLNIFQLENIDLLPPHLERLTLLYISKELLAKLTNRGVYVKVHKLH